MNPQILWSKLLLIYQMPKAGSQTIEATLQHCSLPHLIFRFHFLCSALAEPWASDQLQFRTRMSRVLRARKLLRSCGFNIPKIEVITGLREPIGVMLSSIFENYSYFFSKEEPVRLTEYRNLLLKPAAMNLVQHWFDRELKPFTGIDVFEKPFPCDQGYAIYENKFSRLLLYRYEALKNLSTILREFLGCEVQAVINRNIGSSKEYGWAYHHAKERLRLPVQFVARHCNTKMMRHFYSADERRRLFLQWTAKPALSQPPRDFSAKSCDGEGAGERHAVPGQGLGARVEV
jgi:hypothetical protein